MTWLIGFGSAALLLVSSISVPPVSADVVELRNGQRVEGTSKGADDARRPDRGRRSHRDVRAR